MGLTALVTGGGGFLGGTIVRQLVGRGDTVRSLRVYGRFADIRRMVGLA